MSSVIDGSEQRVRPRALRIYTWAWRLLAPMAVLRLLWRSRHEPLYRAHLAERFGWYGQRQAEPAPTRPLVWLHAVSLGETRAAEPLVDALRMAHPQMRLLLTHMTATGREAGRALLRDGDMQRWLPYDIPGPLRRFLRRMRPDVGVLMETEVWPNLAQICAREGVPLLLANARLSARSATGWARWPGLAQSAYGALTAAAAQTQEDAARLRGLGLRQVSVLGNIKFDRGSNAAMHAQGVDWRRNAGRPVLLLASTREHQGVAEEALLLDAMPEGVLRRALLVVVPRHPQRMEQVSRLLRARGLRVTKRSEAPADAQTQVWLGDSLGEMPAYYAMALAAFVGGSLLPLGGQNLIEASAEGCPVVMGPHVFNFAQAVEQGIAAGAMVQAADAREVWTHLLTWLDDPARRRSAVQAALRFSAEHRGAAEAQAAWIGSYLQPGMRPS